ncbi:MAG: hypothetical protein COA58_14865 [Bacteroidetes bacterium]|nr:MAG: hypothetical protein COA58_14865 [Bacteroidota bacterium]
MTHLFMKYSKLLILVSFLLITTGSLAQDPNASFTILGKCQNQPITFTSTSTAPGASITKEHWYFGTGDAADTLNGKVVSFTFSNVGSFFIELTVTNSLGNSKTTAINLKVEATPVPVIDKTVPCFPAGVTFKDFSNVSEGFIESRVWTTSVGTDGSQTFKYFPPSKGSFPIELKVTSDRGCVASLIENIEYETKPSLVFSPASPVNLCEGDSIVLTVSGANSYLWDNNSKQPNITIKNGRFYKVEGSISKNCSSLDSIEIIVTPKPTADAGNDVTIKLGQKTTLMGDGGVNFSWTPIDFLSDEFSPTPEASPNRTISYILSVLDMNGCVDVDTVIVNVDLNTTIHVHNMITPNGDGYNDKWDLSSVPGIELASIHVFNRWGWEVFKSEDYKNDWQGTFNEEPLTDGSYIYVIEFADDTKTPLRGIIEILRNTQK